MGQLSTTARTTNPSRADGAPPKKPARPKAQLVTEGAGFWGASAKADIRSKP